MRRKKPLCKRLNMIRLVLNYFDFGPYTAMPLTETTPDDIELEKRAKESPEAQFYLHVGTAALSKVKAKSTTMDLNDLEMDAARGMNLAIALDAYADMYHIGQLHGVPTRQDLQLSMNKGEAFWRGFQMARGEIVLKSGFRSKIQNEERLASWMYAKSLNYDCAMEGFAFGVSTGTSGTKAILNEILGADDHAAYTPSKYLESIGDLVTAIERSDQSYFLAT